MYNTKLHFHFTGIGGSGMSGIAEILLSLGFKVSGTDLRDSPIVERLSALGARVSIGHTPESLPSDASLLVYSSAVRQDNPEVVAARSRGIPVIRRAEVLAELMRLKFGVGVAGSHGKTTTTSMTASILERGGLDPTVIIGGQLQASETGARAGAGEYLVAETDESDRSFLLLKPTIAVVTNIDSEHLNAYESFGELVTSFESFVEAIPFYGLAVLCIDCPRVRDIYNSYSRRKISYGLSPDATVRPAEIVKGRGFIEYDVLVSGKKLIRVRLPVPGTHFMVNSLAAVCVALEFGIAPEHISSALNAFPGVRRRVEVSGERDGVLVINDYGHHPTEVRATLDAVRSGWCQEGGKVHVIFQPHRYTRTRDCFVDFLGSFSAADTVTVTDVYSAGEDPIDDISGELLARSLTHSRARYVGDLDAAGKVVMSEAADGDVVVCLGAGSIGTLPRRLLS